MKTKLAIATMIGQNQGNRLQNYALQYVLESLSGCVVETLRVGYGPNYLNRTAKALLYRGFPRKRWARFEAFDSKYIRFARCSTEDSDLARAGYSLFVIGSDQVWNPTFDITSEAEYLPQVPAIMKVSYAASFGVSEIKENRERTSELIKNISRVSVREQNAVRIVQELTGRKPALVLDPSLLVEVDKWFSISRRPEINIPQKGYILKYILGKNVPDQVAISAAEGVASSVIDLKKESLPVGPSEFIWLIANAKFVCTDSFHASVFSTLFHTPFAIFERISDNEDMSSRFETFCATFGLGGRRVAVQGENNLVPIDWTVVDGALDITKKESLGFLEVCLHDAGLA